MKKAPEYSGALNNVFSILEQWSGVAVSRLSGLSNNFVTVSALANGSQVN
jgi:hypothetical protein